MATASIVHLQLLSVAAASPPTATPPPPPPLPRHLLFSYPVSCDADIGKQKEGQSNSVANFTNNIIYKEVLTVQSKKRGWCEKVTRGPIPIFSVLTANRIACFVFYSRSREMNNFIAIVVLRLEVKICIGDHCLSWCCGRSGMSAVVTFSQSRVIGFLSRFPCVLYGIYSSIKEINNSFVGV
uniref:Uncharacterized protein n=1 Tax=Aegilops tauschii TaxID=37682 RepID=M8CF00_AEGTA